MISIKRFLFGLTRSSLLGLIIGWVFSYMSFVIPVDRLRETNTLIAFHHPKPGYPVHILLVPKRKLGGLLDLGTADSDFLVDLFQTVQSLVTELNLEPRGYRLISNGGCYQDVPHLHFHLIAGE